MYLYLSIGSCILFVLSSIRSRVDVDTIMTNIITNLQWGYRRGATENTEWGLTLCLKASLSSIVSVSALAITGTMLTQL